jgi:hypothetical protein
MQAADIGAAGKQVAEMQAETWSAVREQVRVLQQMQVQEREPGQEQVPAVRQVLNWLRVFRSFRKRPVRPERRFRMIHNT